MENPVFGQCVGPKDFRNKAQELLLGCREDLVARGRKKMNKRIHGQD